MKLSKQQIIDQKAQRIFSPALPPDWIIRERHPDFGVDYLIEIFENKEPAGLEFAVQLKGTENPRIVRTTARFSAETPHLVYWMDKIRHPVFLVHIDVKTKQGWWLFIQKYIHDGKIRPDWRAKTKVSVEFPIDQRLDDVPTLRKAIEEAVHFMPNLWPGSIQPSIRAEKARLEGLDPRFVVGVKATENTTDFQFAAREEDVPFTFTFHVNPSEFESAVSEPMARGEPISLANTRVEVSGSKLLQEIISKSTHLHIQKRVRCHVKLRATNGDVLVEPINGEIVGGTREWRFNGALSPPVLRVQSEFPRKNGSQMEIPYDITFDVSKFDGKPVLSLPYFDQLYSLFSALGKQSEVRLELWFQGSRLMSEAMLPKDHELFFRIFRMLTPVHWAREISRHFRIAPVLPHDFDTVVPFDIRCVYLLLTVGEYRIPGQFATGVNLEVDASGRIINGVVNDEMFSMMRVPYHIYDTVLRLPVEFMLTKGVIENIEPVPGTLSAKITYRGIEGGEWVVRRAK